MPTGKNSKGYSVLGRAKKKEYLRWCYDSSANQWVFAKEVTECLDSTSLLVNYCRRGCSYFYFCSSSKWWVLLEDLNSYYCCCSALEFAQSTFFRGCNVELTPICSTLAFILGWEIDANARYYKWGWVLRHNNVELILVSVIFHCVGCSTNEAFSYHLLDADWQKITKH